MLTLAGLGDSVVIEFDVTLAPVIANGAVAANQSQLIVAGTTIANSDDPVPPGATDPTRVAIAPAFSSPGRPRGSA